MATQEEVGVVEPNASVTIGVALSGSKSSTHVLQWALRSFTKDSPRFKLIHVLAVPTPLGDYIPIDKGWDDISDAYVKDVEGKALEMLLPYKDMCDENKVEAEVLLVKGSDVTETISSVVAQYKIKILIVGITAKSAFTGKYSGNMTSSKLSKSVLNFCTTYIVSKDGLSAVNSSGSESGRTSGIHGGSSDSENPSGSDLDDGSGQGSFDFPGPPRSNFTPDDQKDRSSVDRTLSFTLRDYISRTASVRAVKDNRITSSTGGESSLQALMLSDDKEYFRRELECFSREIENTTLRLEKLEEIRLEVQVSYIAQDEYVQASHQVVELAELREKQSRLKKAKEALECAAEEAATHLKNLEKIEVMQTNMLQENTSKEADNMLRLEKLPTPGNSYLTYTWEEIDNATSSFSNSRKIGTGSSGTVYRGYLKHLPVAIKVLHSDNSSSIKHFNKELEVLSRKRHPHLLMLLGACPDRGCLVYEYMANGSLADRLQCIKGTPPLTWFHRFRIAREIASALLFLHSTKPSPVIHGDLKPENVLDGNLVSKIAGLGLAVLLPVKRSFSGHKNICLEDDTRFYEDPEYKRSGKVTAKSDAYALGMVVLEMLTAKSPIGLPEMVELAMENDEIVDVLDASAGNWPLKEANDLARLCLMCLETRSKNRPDLKDVVAELDRLMDTVVVGYAPVLLNMPVNTTSDEAEDPSKITIQQQSIKKLEDKTQAQTQDEAPLFRSRSQRVVSSGPGFKPSKFCWRCLSKPGVVVDTPMKHVCVCYECASTGTTGCPVCKSEIMCLETQFSTQEENDDIRIFLSLLAMGPAWQHELSKGRNAGTGPSGQSLIASHQNPCQDCGKEPGDWAFSCCSARVCSGCLEAGFLERHRDAGLVKRDRVCTTPGVIGLVSNGQVVFDEKDKDFYCFKTRRFLLWENSPGGLKSGSAPLEKSVEDVQQFETRHFCSLAELQESGVVYRVRRSSLSGKLTL